MNFLLSATLRATLINILDSHNYECIALEQLPVILPGTIFTQNRPNSKVPIVTLANEICTSISPP